MSVFRSKWTNNAENEPVRRENKRTGAVVAWGSLSTGRNEGEARRRGPRERRSARERARWAVLRSMNHQLTSSALPDERRVQSPGRRADVAERESAVGADAGGGGGKVRERAEYTADAAAADSAFVGVTKHSAKMRRRLKRKQRKRSAAAAAAAAAASDGNDAQVQDTSTACRYVCTHVRRAYISETQTAVRP